MSTFVTLHTKSIKSAPLIKFQLLRDEPIEDKVRSVLLNSCENDNERADLRSKKLVVRFNDHQISDCMTVDDQNVLRSTKTTLRNLENIANSPITLQAEHDPDNFYDHYHVLRFETPKSSDVDLFYNWVQSHQAKGHLAEIWLHPKAHGFADVKVQKGIMPHDSGLSFTPHLTDLRSKVEKTKATSEHFHEGFHQYPEIVSYLQDMNDRLKAIPGMNSELMHIGKTTMNNDIIGLRVWKDNPKLVFRPKILAIGGMHAREWSGVSTVLFMTEKLLNTHDVETQRILSLTEFHIIPLVNVDGYNLTWTKGNRLWRKNLNNVDPASFSFSGVDINRNFDCHFNEVGISTNPCSETYSGPYANSELETKALSQFVSSQNYLFSIDYHCYSSIIAFPPSFTKRKSPNHALLAQCAREGVKAIKNLHQSKYRSGQISQAIYPCSGTFLDYMHTNGISEFTFVNELNGLKVGFLTRPSDIVSLGNDGFAGLKEMVKYAISHSKNRPVLADESAVYATPSENKGVSHVEEMSLRKGLLRSLGSCEPFVRSVKRVAADSVDPFVVSLSNLWTESFDEIKSNKIIKMMSLGNSKNASEITLDCLSEIASRCPSIDLFKGKLFGKDGATNFGHLYLPLSNDSSLSLALEDYFNGGDRKVIEKVPKVLFVALGRKSSDWFQIPKRIDLQRFLKVKKNGAAFELCAVVENDGNCIKRDDLFTENGFVFNSRKACFLVFEQI